MLSYFHNELKESVAFEDRAIRFSKLSGGVFTAYMKMNEIDHDESREEEVKTGDAQRETEQHGGNMIRDTHKRRL